MRAFVLAAGLGTRLRPYTLSLPKPLFPVCGRPLLGLILERLLAEGCDTLGINLHHLPDRIEGFLRQFQRSHPGVRIVTYREPEILGPTGALRGARDFFCAPTLVVNADVLTNLPYRTAFQAHERLGGLATMILVGARGNVLLEGERVAGFEAREGAFTFTGLQVVSPELVARLGDGDRDLVPTYRRLMAEGGVITAQVVSGIYWRDIGTLPSYLAAHGDILTGRASVPGIEVKGPFVYPQEAPPGLVLEDWAYLPEGVRLHPGSRLRRVVAWPGAEVPPGEHEDRLFAPEAPPPSGAL